MINDIIFDPLVSLPMLIACIGLAILTVFFAFWRGLAGVWWRGFAALVLVCAIANPALQQEERDTLNDIVLVVVDDTSSQRIGGREAQTEEALNDLSRRISGRSNTDLHVVRFGDSDGDQGSLLAAAITTALADIPQSRLAGVVVLSDGLIHDVDAMPSLSAPVHLLRSGFADDWDRRLSIRNAPGYAILGEEVTLTLRIDDMGAPPLPEREAEVQVSINGEAPLAFRVPIGVDLDVPVMLPHGGMNTIQFTTAAQGLELTDRNNTALVQINGVRDRLRVLLVSGEPHPGERTWRNLLKSDSSVDLVHFTILRPPEKQDGVPVNELSLIAFPTRELFLDKIDDFDLIIFDRYQLRGILPSAYLDNVARYVERGGAVLVAAGPDFATANSLYHSALADVLPAAPTARVFEEGYRPEVSEIGSRHPVTEDLMEGLTDWGRWFRLIQLSAPERGQTIMTGVDGQPLLVLDRVGEGRVALLASDHSWLWSRGFEGGGPQAELLRRLAHWMMKEPELEEEALWAEVRGQSMTIVRRTLEESVPDVEITLPDGAVVVRPLTQVSPGQYEVVFDGPVVGLYRLSDGIEDAVVVLGPSAPREFVDTIASDDALTPIVAVMRGGMIGMEEGMPNLRNVRAGRPAAGRGWIGLTPKGAYLTTDVVIRPALPAWLFLLIAVGLMIAGWMREGRR
ncbi:hypothetical protein [Cochlodiniinecator piscidefendens]|uniref:hypothetical protein n=1 Tax=Cochlodiniinecator piscidefendens TaxID=2715756 RepID=UPI00140818DB|nr:hypothetical protein [Cochlodiniinecator piscidefendens]